ncbi:MAG: hypothetical protein KA243_02260 [Candidatus Aminicenantes bacterium]|nr:hypothetical protein [Candidatus Aminicenantes bacterium]
MKIFIGNLAYHADEEDFRSFVEEKVGLTPDKLISCCSPVDGAFRGFAFLIYDDYAVGYRAMSIIDGLEFDGRTIRADKSTPRSK